MPEAPSMPPGAGTTRGRPRTVVVTVLAGGVLLVLLAATLALVLIRGQDGSPSVAVSREAAVELATADVGPRAALQSVRLTTLAATGLLAPPSSPDTLVWEVSFDGLSVPVCPPAPAPGASPPPCHQAAVGAVVVVDAQTGRILTSATSGD